MVRPLSRRRIPLPPRVAQPKLSAVPTDRVGVVRPLGGGARSPATPVRAAGALPRPGAVADGPGRRKGHLRFAGVLPPARIPPESLAPARRVSAIGVAIGVSIALHVVAMMVHFTFGSGRVSDNSPQLQIALVNAKSASKPAQADILAQVNLDGGGNT